MTTHRRIVVVFVHHLCVFLLTLSRPENHPLFYLQGDNIKQLLDSQCWDNMLYNIIIMVLLKCNIALVCTRQVTSDYKKLPIKGVWYPFHSQVLIIFLAA